VGDEDAVQSFEADAGLQDLALRAFAAVDQEAVFFVFNHQRRQVSPG